MKRVTIDYAHFNKAGFDNTTCSVATIDMPNRKTSTKAVVYDTATHAPLFHNQHRVREVVTFKVEFLPFITGKHLLVQAYQLVQDVLADQYKAEPFTLCVHKKDGSVDTKITLNDVIVQQVELFLNRKNEAKGEIGYIRIRFTLQGLHPGV